MITEHPFNRNPDFTKINNTISSLILGSFPPFEVTNTNNYRFNYYYGSNDNKFWELFLNSFDINNVTMEEISNKLSNSFGIIDIIYRCRRKNNNSSSDNDLSLIEFEDIYNILRQYINIKKIYFTSFFVYELFVSKILKPLLSDNNRNNEELQIYGISNKINKFYLSQDRSLLLFILPSPSPQGLRNLRGFGYIEGDKEIFRKDIYRKLLNYNGSV